jgi:tetratricopeptide (TPR) repeat protein
MAILYFVGKRLEAFMIAWVVITLLPSLAILYSQMAAPIGERYLYLPSAGFCLLLATVFTKIRSPKTMVASALVILSVYAFSTFDRVGDWKDEVTIWKDTAQKNSGSDPNTVTAHLNYGASLARIGEFEKAREMLMIALGQKKISFNQAGSILNLLGMLDIKAKDYTKAEENFLNSLKLYPDNAETYNNLGFLYSVLKDEPGLDKGQQRQLLEKAIGNYGKALSLFPDFIQAKYNLGLSYMQMNDLANAEKYLNAVIKSDPQGGYARKAANLLGVIKLKREREH